MRSPRYIKTTKYTCRHKVHKKRHKSKCTVGCTPAVSILNFEDINEVLRVNRANIRKQQAEGKGSWKVVPKDSCEVYKNRRKRQAESRGDKDSDMKTDSEASSGQKKKRRSDRNTKRPPAKKSKTKKRQPRRRRKENSSMSSYTTTATSGMSSSEMDYE